jgi:hypothetical protein
MYTLHLLYLGGQPDAILKFVQQENLLTFVSSRPVDGDILDLACTDLNQDGKQELLATVRIGKKILIEPMEPIQ